MGKAKNVIQFLDFIVLSSPCIIEQTGDERARSVTKSYVKKLNHVCYEEPLLTRSSAVEMAPLDEDMTKGEVCKVVIWGF